MANERMLLDVAIALGTGIVYAYVGRVTSLRRIGGEAQLAVTLFSVWWYTLAAITWSGAGGRLLGYFGVLDIGIHLTILHVALIALSAAFWGLQYYLFYLFTGSKRWLAPITIYYVLLYLSLLYMIIWRQPTGVTIEGTAVTVGYAREVARPLLVALGIAFLLPTVIGAIGYARLFFRVDTPTQRYRIGLVSFTIIIWFSISLIATTTGLNQAPWWQGVSRYFGLVAALLILAAYRPPGFVQRRWGIQPVTASADRPT